MSLKKLGSKGTLFGKPESSVVKHPGALTAAAKRNNRSTLEEANVESHSSNPHIRARGALGKRFIKGKL